MQTIADRSFIDETVDVDGKEFHRCTFERCVLIFHGREVFSTIECRLENGNTFELADSANIVIQQFRLFLSYGGIFGDTAKHFLYSPSAVTTAKLH